MSLKTCCTCLFGSCGAILFVFFALVATIVYFEEDPPNYNPPQDTFVPQIKAFPIHPTIPNFGARTTNRDSTLTIETITSVPAISKLETLSVLFQITTPEIENAQTRPPFELCVVLDNSGSMHGPKMDYSKEAIRNILKNLQKDDIFHLITYSTDAKIYISHISGKDAQHYIEDINKIKIEGSTNMYSGLSLAKHIFSTSNYPKKTRRVFLFSDGLVNAGVTNPQEINALVQDMYKTLEVTTLSFGIGADFDETLMSSIASSGKGDFLFLDNAVKIPDLVTHALQGLSTLLGHSTVLFITPTEGVQFASTYSPIELGDLRAMETKQEYIELHIKALPKNSPMQILNYKLQYQDAATKTLRVVSGVVQIGISDKPVATAVDAEVLKFKRLRYVRDQDEEASNYLRAQKYTAAIALTRNNIKVLNEAQEFERDIQWKTQLERENKILNDIEKQKDYNAASKRYSYYSSISKGSSNYYGGHS